MKQGTLFGFVKGAKKETSEAKDGKEVKKASPAKASGARKSLRKSPRKTSVSSTPTKADGNTSSSTTSVSKHATSPSPRKKSPSKASKGARGSDNDGEPPAKKAKAKAAVAAGRGAATSKRKASAGKSEMVFTAAAPKRTKVMVDARETGDVKARSQAASAAAAASSSAAATAPSSVSAKKSAQAASGGTDAGADADEAKRKEEYRKFVQRPGPPRKGEKDVPVGAPDCLVGKNFLITGVLDSLERDEAAELIQRHGGTVCKSVTKKLTHAVVGTDPGSKKMELLGKRRDVKQLDEDGLFDLIRNAELSPAQRKEHEAELKRRAEAQEKKLAAEEQRMRADAAALAKEEKAALAARAKLAASASPAKAASSSAAASSSSAAAAANLGSIQTMGIAPRREQTLWVEKHRPRKSSDLVGNEAHLNRMKKWLKDWDQNHTPVALARSNRKDFNAVLLSGVPGIGKTSMAMIVCRECGFEPKEFNASDVRNKSSVEAQIGLMLGNHGLGEYFSSVAATPAASNAPKKRIAIIMDEVDGMSSGDRGGMQALIAAIKKTMVPIVCICNDRHAQKVRSLRNYCLDLPFRKPTPLQSLPRLMGIAAMEGLKIDTETMTKIYLSCDGDIRQTLGLLQMIAVRHRRDLLNAQSKEGARELDRELSLAGKVSDLGPFAILPALFGAPKSATAKRNAAAASIAQPGNVAAAAAATDDEDPSLARNPIDEKLQYHWMDSALVPLFVHENYFKFNPYFKMCEGKQLTQKAIDGRHLKLLSLAMDSMAQGDVVSAKLRELNRWDLSSAHGVLSTVAPAFYMRGQGSGQVEFPSWLGKNSSANKFKRMAREVQVRMSMTTSGTATEIVTQYLPVLRHSLTRPLRTLGKEGIDSVVDLMNTLHLTRDDFTAVMELSQFPGFEDPAGSNAIESAVKAAFTRKLNLHKAKYFIPVGKAASAANFASKGSSGGGDGDEMEDEDDNTKKGDDDDDDDDAGTFVKEKKSKSKSTAAKGKKRKAKS